MLSAGFDAAVVHRVVAWRSGDTGLRRVSRLSYAKPIVLSLRTYRYHRVGLETEEVSVEGAHALVFNLPRYGFHLPFAPDARGDDGWLDWVVFQRPGLGPLLAYAWAVLRGKHRFRQDVRYGRARRIRIVSEETMPIQMDGEAAGFTPVTIEVVPRALNVLVDSD